MYKHLAPLSLLSTYNEERVPVIQEMLQLTSKLLNTALELKSSDHASANNSPSHSTTSGGGNEAAGPRRGGAGGADRPKSLDQLGIHCRWSSIVLDDRSPYSDSKDSGVSALSPYGMGVGDGKIRAGDRAPEAPELVLLRDNVVNTDATGESVRTSLFKLFDPTKHTVLFFVISLDSDLKEIQGVFDVLATWPRDTLRIVIVLPKDTPASITTTESFHSIVQTSEKSLLKLSVVIDSEGHAQNVYGSVVEDGYPVFVVRPDGVVGGIVKGGEGVERYTKGIFGGVN